MVPTHFLLNYTLEARIGFMFFRELQARSLSITLTLAKVNFESSGPFGNVTGRNFRDFSRLLLSICAEVQLCSVCVGSIGLVEESLICDQ